MSIVPVPIMNTKITATAASAKHGSTPICQLDFADLKDPANGLHTSKCNSDPCPAAAAFTDTNNEDTETAVAGALKPAGWKTKEKPCPLWNKLTIATSIVSGVLLILLIFKLMSGRQPDYLS